jgi:DNA-binding response OmpR family regulator
MKLLLVEDSARLRRSLEEAFRRSGHAVDSVDNGDDGLALALGNDYDVIVLDVMLPGLDGMTVVERLRQAERSPPVLLLTARDTVADRVRGFELGADDYLIKPFALEELLARVHALSRRRYQAVSNTVAVGALTVDMGRKHVSWAGHPIELTPREYRLLTYLVLRRGQVLSREQIEANIYDDLKDPASNVVESCISTLRKKLAACGASALIQTRRGLGYVLDEEAH